MNSTSSSVTGVAANLSLSTVSDRASRAGQLLAFLERGQAVATKGLGDVMTSTFEGTDAEDFWLWKDAYEACEAGQALFLRKLGPAIRARSGSRSSALAMIVKIAQLLPTHTRRSGESQALQQLSTPAPLAGIMDDDVVLEPSAGTGLLTIYAEIARARMALYEYATVRGSLLERLFPNAGVTRYHAAHINDYLDRAISPTVVLMIPPFSAGAHVEGRVTDAAWRHLTSTFARLAPRSRLVAITGADLSPGNPNWRDALVRLQEPSPSAPLVDGKVYTRHGTTTETRLAAAQRRIIGDRTHRRPDTTARARDEPVSCRTLRLFRGDAWMAEVHRPVPGDHLLEDKDVRTDDHGKHPRSREAGGAVSADRYRPPDLRGE
jgi:hypothetical protein